MRPLAPACALLAAALLLPVLPGGSSGAGFDWHAAGCSDLGLVVPVDAAKVRALVPPDVALLGEASGKVLVNVGFQHCKLLATDPWHLGPSDGSVAVAFIQSPDGGPPGEVYVLWFLTDRADLVALLAAHGFGGAGTVTGISFANAPATPSPPFVGFPPPASTVAATVPWAPGAYAASAVEAGEGPVGPPGITLWHEDAGVLHRLDLTFLDTPQGGAAAGTLQAGAGPAGDLLGAGTTAAPGLWYLNDYAANVS
jgi:hypothetical protein